MPRRPPLPPTRAVCLVAVGALLSICTLIGPLIQSQPVLSVRAESRHPALERGRASGGPGRLLLADFHAMPAAPGTAGTIESSAVSQLLVLGSDGRPGVDDGIGPGGWPDGVGVDIARHQDSPAETVPDAEGPGFRGVIWLSAGLVMVALFSGWLLRLRASLKRGERLERALEASGAGTWDWQLDSGRLTVDEQWAAIAGYTLAELSPVNVRTWVRLCHPEDRAAAFAMLRRHLRGELPVCQHEVRVHHKAGHWVWVLERGRVVAWDAAGLPLRAAGMRFDITAKKRAEDELRKSRAESEAQVAARTADLEASAARFRGLAEQSLVGVYMLDEGRLTFVNQYLADLFGFASAAAMIDRIALPELALPEDRAQIAVRLQRLQEGQTDALHHVFGGKRADGRPISVEVYGHRLQQGAGSAVIGILLDVTERQAAEGVERAALDAAERLSRLRSQFVSNVSHELRTPLNGILGMAAVGARAGDLASAQHALERILQCGRQLLGLIENLLDFAALDAGALALVPARFKPADALTRLAARARDRCQAKGLAFQFRLADDLPAACVGDERRLEQVLSQLLDNAVKFTDSGSVSLTAGRDAEWLVLHIEDTGIGMAAEQVSYLFHPFEQANGGTTRRFGGMGLGLALVGRLVERLGGSIHVHSVPGHGSSFEVRLPLMAAPADAPEGVAADSLGRLAGVSVLLVDDLEATRRFVAGLLAREGAVVDVAQNGSAALQKAASPHDPHYDIVLTGQVTPDIDAAELARRLRQQLPAVPVIALPPDPRGAPLALTGGQDSGVKPFDADSVIRRVRDCLQPGAGDPNAAGARLSP